MRSVTAWYQLPKPGTPNDDDEQDDGDEHDVGLVAVVPVHDR